MKSQIQRTTAAAVLALIANTAFAGGHSLGTEDILNQHLGAFGALDIEALMTHYTEDSVIMLPGATLSGTDQIRGAFLAFIEEFSKPGMSFDLTYATTHGNIAYITWTAETADNVYGPSTDTFLIEDGIIKVQTLTMDITPK